MNENNSNSELIKQLTRIADSLEIISESRMFQVATPDIVNIGLLTATEFNIFKNRMSVYKGDWWLDSQDKYTTEGIFVTEDNNVEKIDTSVDWIHVRPCVRITNGAEFQYKQNVKIGKYSFVYMGENILICSIGIQCVPYSELLSWPEWKWENLVYGTWDWTDANSSVARAINPAELGAITLLSEKEFKRMRNNIPILEKDWWLREGDGIGLFTLVSNGTYINNGIMDLSVTAGVRPAFIVDGNKLGLKKREKVTVNNILFTYIGENYILADSILAECMFDRRGKRWPESELRTWLLSNGRNDLLKFTTKA